MADVDAVEEISCRNGTCGAPTNVGSGFDNPYDVAIGGNGRLYVVDLYNIWGLAP
ncbi:MAG: hypothetical protein ACREUL_11200 [Steroidobacteraceae bacterium]